MRAFELSLSLLVWYFVAALFFVLVYTFYNYRMTRTIASLIW